MSKESSFTAWFAKYVSLNVLSMTGLSLYILVDTFFVAKGMGNQGLTALNLVIPVYNAINAVGLMIGMGAATRFTMLRAQNRQQAADGAFTHAFVLGCAFGVVFTVLGVLFSDKLVYFLGARGEIIPLANSYIRTILCFSLAFILNQVFVCFVRNDQRPKLAMAAMISGSLLNVLLDYIFIFPFGWGMFGAAAATCCSPIASMIILSSHRIQKHNHFHFTRCRPQPKIAGRICALGSASFITEISSGIVIMLFNYTILSISPQVGVAAYGVITNLAIIVMAIFTGIAQGIQPIVSHLRGKNDVPGMCKALYMGLGLSLVLGGVFFLCGALFPQQLVGIFNKDGDQAFLQLAVQGVRIYFIAFWFMGLNIVTGSFFSSIGQARSGFFITLGRGLVLVIALLFVLSPIWGMLGVWLATPLAEALCLPATLLLLHRFVKKGPPQTANAPATANDIF